MSEKIRTLIAYDNEEIQKQIIKTIKHLNYVEIVGISVDGKETYEKIVELNPEMVFIGFDLKNMNALEIMKKSKENLEIIPIFNVIENRALGEDVGKMVRLIKINFNALIHEKENIRKRVKSIFKDYIEYKELVSKNSAFRYDF